VQGWVAIDLSVVSVAEATLRGAACIRFNVLGLYLLDALVGGAPRLWSGRATIMLQLGDGEVFMDWALVATIVVLVMLVGAAITVVALRGRFSGDAELGNAKFRIKAARDALAQPGVATISRSIAKTGDATAVGTGGASIEDTVAGGSLTAEAGKRQGPKA
jgi:hypothetical protein